MDKKAEATGTSSDEQPGAGAPDGEQVTRQKRPYEAPVLLKWGTLQQITQQVGWQGASDGGRLLLRRTRW